MLTDVGGQPGIELRLDVLGGPLGIQASGFSGWFWLGSRLCAVTFLSATIILPGSLVLPRANRFHGARRSEGA